MNKALLGLLLVSPLAFAQEIQFDSAPEPLKLPFGMYFGEVTGVAVNKAKHVFVLSLGRENRGQSPISPCLAA